jgi:hypothetical protein
VVIHQVNRPEPFGRHFKIIATINLDTRPLPTLKQAFLMALAGEAIFFEEGADGHRAQFDAYHFKSVLREPQHVEAFATQRHQYTGRSLVRLTLWPVRQQMRAEFGLMERNLVPPPHA